VADSFASSSAIAVLPTENLAIVAAISSTVLRYRLKATAFLETAPAEALRLRGIAAVPTTASAVSKTAVNSDPRLVLGFVPASVAGLATLVAITVSRQWRCH